jgi:hypothetical protein
MATASSVLTSSRVAAAGGRVLVRRPVACGKHGGDGERGGHGKIDRADAISGADMRQRQQRERDAGRPGVDQDRHRGRDLASGEPVGHHLGELHIEQHAARAGHQPACDLPAPAVAERHRQIAGQHHEQRCYRGRLVAEFLPDRAARQRECYAGREIKPDQDTDVGKAGEKFAPEQWRYGGDALELKRHREADREQNGKNTPAIAQHVPPVNPWGT